MMADITTTKASLMAVLDKYCAPFEEESDLAAEQENNLPRQFADIPRTTVGEITTPTMAEVISQLSTEVSTDTDLCYRRSVLPIHTCHCNLRLTLLRRYMANFNAYLISNQYIAPGESIFRAGDLPVDTPFYIVTWIMSL